MLTHAAGTALASDPQARFGEELVHEVADNADAPLADYPEPCSPASRPSRERVRRPEKRMGGLFRGSAPALDHGKLCVAERIRRRPAIGLVAQNRVIKSADASSGTFQSVATTASAPAS